MNNFKILSLISIRRNSFLLTRKSIGVESKKLNLNNIHKSFLTLFPYEKGTIADKKCNSSIISYHSWLITVSDRISKNFRINETVW